MPMPEPFSIPVPPRCFHPANPREATGCGELAAWMRPSRVGFPVGYFCDRHRADGDQLIPDLYLFHRVTVIAEITMAGVDFAASPARSEALDRLAAAVASIGGVLNLVDVASVVTRAPRQAPAGRTIARGAAGSGRAVGS